MCVYARKTQKIKASEPCRSRIETLWTREFIVKPSQPSVLWFPVATTQRFPRNVCQYVCASVSIPTICSQTNFKNLHLHTHTLPHTHKQCLTAGLSNRRKILSLIITIIFCFVIHYTLFFQEEKNRKSHFITIINQIKSDGKDCILYAGERAAPSPPILYTLKRKKALYK